MLEDQDAKDAPTLQKDPSFKVKRVNRTTRRASSLAEGAIKAEIEEDNRRRAARYVADDKWEEASTSVCASAVSILWALPPPCLASLLVC